ncbi:hypothetical protein [Acetobacter pasteurianus]|nr:hypothetical protein [Acetobacter pasteurianus]
MRSHVTLVTDVTGKNYYSPHVRARARVEGNGNNLSHLSHLSQTDELEAIAQLVDRLLPDRRDPEAFHAAKSEAVGRLRGLIRRIRLGNEGKRGG